VHTVRAGQVSSRLREPEQLLVTPRFHFTSHFRCCPVALSIDPLNCLRDYAAQTGDVLRVGAIHLHDHVLNVDHLRVTIGFSEQGRGHGLEPIVVVVGNILVPQGFQRIKRTSDFVRVAQIPENCRGIEFYARVASAEALHRRIQRRVPEGGADDGCLSAFVGSVA